MSTSLLKCALTTVFAVAAPISTLGDMLVVDIAEQERNTSETRPLAPGEYEVRVIHLIPEKEYVVQVESAFEPIKPLSLMGRRAESLQAVCENPEDVVDQELNDIAEEVAVRDDSQSTSDCGR